MRALSVFGAFARFISSYSPDELRSLPLSSVMTQWSTGGLDSADDKDEDANVSVTFLI